MAGFQYNLLAILFVSVSATAKLPSSMTQHQYCSGCIATIKELLTALSKERILPGERESTVMDVMEKICSNPNFVQYEYSPPKSVEACEVLMEYHEESIETALVKGTPNLEQLICYDTSEACVGVDLSNKDGKAKFSDIDFTEGRGAKVAEVDPSDSSVKFAQDEDAKPNKEEL